MKIIITNAAEAGMPEEMVGHCEQLLVRRIENQYSFLPEEGDDITILYSEKDPLFETEEQDDNAYFIYFSVSKVLSPDEADRSKASVYVDLAF